MGRYRNIGVVDPDATEPSESEDGLLPEGEEIVEASMEGEATPESVDVPEGGSPEAEPTADA
ncbi:MAG: hypothetical protein IJ521_04460 [Schwartzia sp.]|nr:hypothetical protein [Schwartzia sp. (in: firmicutes)]